MDRWHNRGYWGTCFWEFFFFFEGKPSWWCILIWSDSYIICKNPKWKTWRVAYDGYKSNLSWVFLWDHEIECEVGVKNMWWTVRLIVRLVYMVLGTKTKENYMQMISVGLFGKSDQHTYLGLGCCSCCILWCDPRWRGACAFRPYFPESKKVLKEEEVRRDGSLDCWPERKPGSKRR